MLFWKPIFIFKISTLKFFKMQKRKIWDQKCLICFLLGKIWKNYCRVWCQHTWMFQNSHFCSKQKIWDQYALFGYFSAEISKNYSHTVSPLISAGPIQAPPFNNRCTFGYPHWNKSLPLISAAPLNAALIRIVTT